MKCFSWGKMQFLSADFNSTTQGKISSQYWLPVLYLNLFLYLAHLANTELLHLSFISHYKQIFRFISFLLTACFFVFFYLWYFKLKWLQVIIILLLIIILIIIVKAWLQLRFLWPSLFLFLSIYIYLCLFPSIPIYSKPTKMHLTALSGLI